MAGDGIQPGLTAPNVPAESLVTFGTVSALVLNPNQRKAIFVYNPNASVVIAIAPLGTTASINGAGSVTLQPAQGITLEQPLFTNGLNAIAASGSGNSITIWQY